MRILFFALLLVSQTARAEFTVPALTGPVVDTAGFLHEDTKQQLGDFLRNLHDQGGAQIQVAAIPDLNGISIEEAATKITDNWKLGKTKEDRGILFLIAVAEHKLRIEVGLGLQGDLPDVIANRIIREVVAPKMRQGSPDRAVIDGVMAIAHYTDPNLVEAAEQPRMHSVREPDTMGTLLFWFFLCLFGLLFVLPIFSKTWRQRLNSGGGGGYYGGGWGGGGGWSGGGGFGGGWSGGGGGFNGGGSSGSW